MFFFVSFVISWLFLEFMLNYMLEKDKYRVFYLKLMKSFLKLEIIIWYF